MFTWFFIACFLTGPAHGLEAGAAKIDITPPLGTPLAGYFDRLGRGATAIHDPVWARCLYLDDGDTNLFLVTADLCAIPREFRDEVLKLAPGIVPRRHVILAATHTHNGPGGMTRSLLFRPVAGRFMPDLLEAAAQKIAGCMGEAYEARQRATIGHGTAKQTVLSENLWQAGGAVDEQIGVIRVDDADGRAIAIVANFAAHPTTVGEEDRYAISADYPGYFYDALEGLSDRGCVALFTNGAAGNLGCGNLENKQGWARTESIGRLLAIRVKEVANRIDCGEAKLHVGYATPPLPATLAQSFLPSSTVLQTLEVDDLLMAFVPGEPCVEIGLALRQQALERGYDAQFTVSVANDHLFYFVPRASYSRPHYESAMSFYGPRIEGWFYREFSKLMTRHQQEPEPQPAVTPNVERAGPARRIILSGTPYEIGYQRGAAFRQVLADAFHGKVVERVASGEWAPTAGMWTLAPGFVDLTPLALPRLAINARPMLRGMADGVFGELEGMSDGAGLPFDALWLIQSAPVFAMQGPDENLYGAGSCTMFAAVGERAGAEDLLVGRNFDWPDPEPPVIVEVRPAAGHSFIQVGFPWNVGVFTGMNDAGLVLCLERIEGLGTPSLEGPPLELVLRGLLETVATMDDAVAALQARSYLRGYHVLVAEPAGPNACVVELGEPVTVRTTVHGLLLGADPDGAVVDAHAGARYDRVRALLGSERIIGPDEVKQVLLDAEDGAPARARIYNDFTRHCVVFRPKTRQIQVAFPAEAGVPGEFATIATGWSGS